MLSILALSTAVVQSTSTPTSHADVVLLTADMRSNLAEKVSSIKAKMQPLEASSSSSGGDQRLRNLASSNYWLVDNTWFGADCSGTPSVTAGSLLSNCEEVEGFSIKGSCSVSNDGTISLTYNYYTSTDCTGTSIPSTYPVGSTECTPSDLSMSLSCVKSKEPWTTYSSIVSMNYQNSTCCGDIYDLYSTISIGVCNKISDTLSRKYSTCSSGESALSTDIEIVNNITFILIVIK